MTADTNTQLTDEQVQDIVGAMVDGGTETNISVTYDDTSGKLNFVSTDTNTTYSEATGSAAGLMSIAHHDKLDGIEASADVTDATNVTAAGALMDSELTDLAGVKGVTISTLQVKPSEGAFANGDKTKLDAIEASADVTDATNVTAAGALMDSELTDLAGIKSLDTSTLATLAGAQEFTGKKTINTRAFAITDSSTHGDCIGDVIYTGLGTLTAGKIYYLRSNNTWTETDADAAASSTGLIGVALGSSPTTNGVLLRGAVTLSEEIGGTEAIGSILYLDTTAATATITAPSGSGDIVRVIGYSLATDNDMIWFNPDGAWVEIA